MIKETNISFCQIKYMNEYAIFIIIKINNICTHLARMTYDKPNRHRETHFNVVRSFVCFFRLKLKSETHLDTRKSLLKIMITILNVIEIFKVTFLELLTNLTNSHATPQEILREFPMNTTAPIIYISIMVSQSSPGFT